ncbi:MAG: helix-turn-helix transcriptional regulator [Coriobacteriales bacterium]
MEGKFNSIVSPAYTGVTFLFSWTYLLFYTFSAGIEASPPISLMSLPYLISASCMVITLFVIAFSPLNRVEVLSKPAVKISVPLIMAASTAVLIWVTVNSGPLAVMCVSAVTTGISSGTMSQQWVMAYRRVGLRVAVNSFPTLMAMSITMCMSLLYFPQIVVYLAIVVFPLISGFLFHEVRKNPWPELIIESGKKNKPLNYFLLLFPVAIYSISSGFFDYFSSNSNYSFVFYALSAFIPLVLAVIAIFISDRKNLINLVVIPICFIVVVTIPFLTRITDAPVAQFISIGELGMEVLFFLAVIGFSDYLLLDMFKTCAFVKCTVVVLNSLGWYFGLYAASAYDSLWHSQFSLLLIMVAIEISSVFLVWALYKVKKSLEIAGEQNGQSTQSEEAGDSGVQVHASESDTDGNNSRNLKCEAIARKYGLSKREVDVFELLARGYSSAGIQSTLYIAQGTVNYHTRNIYSKLGVHSKQELIDLVDSESLDDLADGN